jgi:hypothetical protein
MILGRPAARRGATAGRSGRSARAVLLAVTAAAAVAACSSTGAPVDTAAPPAKAPAAELPFASPARHVGPQGRVGQFVVECRYSHSAPDDPIVHPGMSGMSHRHDFYGATEVSASSTAASLLATPTTCDKTVDTAAYWHPTLYDHDEAVTPISIAAYYRAAPGVDPTSVQTMPTGLALIAGDQAATEPQSGEATGWTCGSTSAISDDPPDCPAGAPLHLVLTFQDCWDGVHLESEDTQSHVTYSTDGGCPASHPVSIPQLTVSVAFPVAGTGHDLRLASGSTYSAHGDFLNAWDPAGLQREIDMCIHRGAVCDLASNRAEELPFRAS